MNIFTIKKEYDTFTDYKFIGTSMKFMLYIGKPILKKDYTSLPVEKSFMLDSNDNDKIQKLKLFINILIKYLKASDINEIDLNIDECYEKTNNMLNMETVDNMVIQEILKNKENLLKLYIYLNKNELTKLIKKDN